ncbi:transporter substrate-binding domain-containing protein [Alkalimonas delamerensis]|uniref:Transporter substrate-binding domain-containing protein n=1 Tax=Alkalimonas delamerensis TaxID=265981 RepID=A0ABT9GQK7_9GAMM|nr:transporter substrate-binding domain-containing protein [Alkalimonas delamerensis]MDP4529262.1 transporter substrate-binding domain-containing protein [Alkalimonas delamerensis]
MRFPCLIPCIALTWLLSSWSLAMPAAKPVSTELSINPIWVATDLWPGFTEPSQQGAYLHLMQLIFPAETEVQVYFTSFIRSILMTEQQQVHMVIGIGAKDSNSLLLSEWPFDIDKIALLHLAGQLHLSDKADLAKLRLATQRGYNYDQLLNITTESYEVDSIQTGVSLVKNNRVDAFLVEKAELRHQLQEQELSGLQLVFLKGEPIYMGFADNEAGRQLKAWWDQHYQYFYREGLLLPLYQQYPNFHLPEPIEPYPE